MNSLTTIYSSSDVNLEINISCKLNMAKIVSDHMVYSLDFPNTAWGMKVHIFLNCPLEREAYSGMIPASWSTN
jgi:hypothetical protein